MSWADANLSADHAEQLAQRITDLEHTITTQLSELRNEVGLATATMRGEGSTGSVSMVGDLEAQLAHAVSVSLSAALDAIRQSLTEAVGEAVQQLASSIEALVESQPRVEAGPPLEPTDLEEVAASLQHAVLLALSTFEPSSAGAAGDPLDGPATARDLARVNHRIDELRSLLLG